MSREEMMNEVIKTRGFEDKWTIWFCGLAESNLTDSQLEMAMVCALSMGSEEEEEE